VTPVTSEYVTNGPPTISQLQEDHNHSRSTNVERSKLLVCIQLDKSLAESLEIPLTRVFLGFGDDYGLSGSKLSTHDSRPSRSSSPVCSPEPG
jgi:hypothetical protein